MIFIDDRPKSKGYGTISVVDYFSMVISFSSANLLVLKLWPVSFESSMSPWGSPIVYLWWS